MINLPALSSMDIVRPRMDVAQHYQWSCVDLSSQILNGTSILFSRLPESGLKG